MRASQGFLLLAACLLSGCSEEQKTEPVRPVLFAEVQQQDHQLLGRFAGSIEARVQSTLGFRISGRVAQRLVDAGAEVKAGEVLATLDPTDQINSLRANEGDQARAEAQWINAQANARRQQELFDRGVGAKASLEQAQTDLSDARSTFEQAEANTRQAKDRLTYGVLSSDYAAVLTAWHVEAGQVVAAGQQVVTLARPEIKEAVFDLPVELADTLDDAVQFNISSQLDPSVTTRGHLRELEPRADSATRTRRARLALEQSPPGLRLGTAISIQLSRPQPIHSLIPPSAVQQINGQAQVWLIDSQTLTVHPQPIQVLGSQEDLIAVSGNLAPGDKVVRAGLNQLKDGQSVRIDKSSAP